MFVGPYMVTASGDGMNVTNDPSGLGYFHAPSWQKRYSGNESQGYMLSAAFRIFRNTTNVELIPAVGLAGQDTSVKGREAPQCKSCHFDAWYALDRAARLLPRKQVDDNNDITFAPPSDGPQQLLGKTMTTDKDLVTALVDSDAWRFAQCRNVFLFLYGRAENQCEAKIFDACVSALEQTKTIQSAVAAVAKDSSFCSN
jgi:hypothetical protein